MARVRIKLLDIEAEFDLKHEVRSRWRSHAADFLVGVAATLAGAWLLGLFG